MTFGLLIRPDTHTVHDVHADCWTAKELREQLQLDGEEIVRREVERSGDWIFVSDFLNATATATGEAARCEGFDLFGDRYFGPALIVAGEENGLAPILDPHDISRAIHFFRLEPSGSGVAQRQPRVSLHAHH